MLVLEGTRILAAGEKVAIIHAIPKSEHPLRACWAKIQAACLSYVLKGIFLDRMVLKGLKL
jgi:hypothetical protein